MNIFDYRQSTYIFLMSNWTTAAIPHLMFLSDILFFVRNKTARLFYFQKWNRALHNLLVLLRRHQSSNSELLCNVFLLNSNMTLLGNCIINHRLPVQVSLYWCSSRKWPITLLYPFRILFQWHVCSICVLYYSVYEFALYRYI